MNILVIDTLPGIDKLVNKINESGWYLVQKKGPYVYYEKDKINNNVKSNGLIHKLFHNKNKDICGESKMNEMFSLVYYNILKYLNDEKSSCEIILYDERIQSMEGKHFNSIKNEQYIYLFSYSSEAYMYKTNTGNVIPYILYATIMQPVSQYYTNTFFYDNISMILLMIYQLNYNLNFFRKFGLGHNDFHLGNICFRKELNYMNNTNFKGDKFSSKINNNNTIEEYRLSEELKKLKTVYSFQIIDWERGTVLRENAKDLNEDKYILNGCKNLCINYDGTMDLKMYNYNLMLNGKNNNLTDNSFDDLSNFIKQIMVYSVYSYIKNSFRYSKSSNPIVNYIKKFISSSNKYNIILLKFNDQLIKRESSTFLELNTDYEIKKENDYIRDSIIQDLINKNPTLKKIIELYECVYNISIFEELVYDYTYSKRKISILDVIRLNVIYSNVNVLNIMQDQNNNIKNQIEKYSNHYFYLYAYNNLKDPDEYQYIMNDETVYYNRNKRFIKFLSQNNILKKQ